MDERDELQALWQTQPVDRSEAPRFGLIEDMTAPTTYPLSREMRWGNAVGLLLMAFHGRQVLRESSSSFELATAWLMLGACVAGAIALFLPIGGKAREMPAADASVSEYRHAMALEFMRQTRVERRIYMPVFGVMWLSMILRVTAEAAREGFAWYHAAVPVMFTALFGWLLWYVREQRSRATRRILSGL